MEGKDKITCNVIKDLLPSYVDNICSEDSRKLVEEHVQDCDGCQELLNMLKKTVLIAEKAEKGQLNYMQRVKQKYQEKSLVGFKMFWILAIFAVLCLLYECGHRAYEMFYIIEPVLIVGTYFLLSKNAEAKTNWKLSIVFILISIVSILYVGGLAWRSCRWLNGDLPYGVEELSMLGGYITRRLLAVIFIQYFIFLCCVLLSFWNLNVNRFSYGLFFICFSMALVFYSTLRNMSFFSEEKYIKWIAANFSQLIIEGVAAIFVTILYDKCIAKRKSINKI